MSIDLQHQQVAELEFRASEDAACSASPGETKMKKLILAAALLCGGFILAPSAVQAAPLNIGVGVGVGFGTGGVYLNLGSVAFNQRYVVAGQAWVNEPYIYWINVPDPFTGRVYPVQRIGYTRRLVVLYLDTWQGGYGYFDRWGNPVPYRRW
ncbi:MAG: hypothetical protein K2X27_09490 [Candidatus Obscuribacterales bacterium]|nr:hypothetical protein [Candidatus Obscuribacterales bacterium]